MEEETISLVDWQKYKGLKTLTKDPCQLKSKQIKDTNDQLSQNRFDY